MIQLIIEIETDWSRLALGFNHCDSEHIRLAMTHVINEICNLELYAFPSNIWEFTDWLAWHGFTRETGEYKSGRVPTVVLTLNRDRRGAFITGHTPECSYYQYGFVGDLYGSSLITLLNNFKGKYDTIHEA